MSFFFFPPLFSVSNTPFPSYAFCVIRLVPIRRFHFFFFWVFFFPSSVNISYLCPVQLAVVVFFDYCAFFSYNSSFILRGLLHGTVFGPRTAYIRETPYSSMFFFFRLPLPIFLLHTSLTSHSPTILLVCRSHGFYYPPLLPYPIIHPFLWRNHPFSALRPP